MVSRWPQRLQRLTSGGRPDQVFAAAVSKLVTEPVDAAIDTRTMPNTLFVLDAAQRRVIVIDITPDRSGTVKPVHLAEFGQSEQLTQPLGLAVSGDTVYVGDNDRRRVLCYRQQQLRRPDAASNPGPWEFVGEAIGYSGPVAGLAADGRGGLWVHSGHALDPVRLEAAGGFVTEGLLWGGLIANPSLRERQWHRLTADFGSRRPSTSLDEDSQSESGNHVQFLIKRDPLPSGTGPIEDLSSVIPDHPDVRMVAWPPDQTAPLQSPPDPAWTQLKPFSADGWQTVSVDAPECLIPGGLEMTDGKPEGLSVGLRLAGDGLHSPTLHQIRLDFDHETLLKHLPAIFVDPVRLSDQDLQAPLGGPPGSFLARFVTLFESLFLDVEERSDALSQWLDPGAVPEDALDWLAGWLAVDLPGSWALDRKRQAVSAAFSESPWRGTTHGLRLALRRMANVEVHVDEPILHASWWALPEQEGSPFDSASPSLGLTTMLAAEDPQGAVLGSSAIVGASHIIADEDYGTPLFDDLAYRFTASVYEGSDVSPARLAEIASTIEQAMPAHTAYHVCVVRPLMRIGFQARLGIDAVIADRTDNKAGTANAQKGAALVLGDPPAAQIGRNARLGRTFRVIAR
ncbi:MAG: phage tail protein [Anaerolineae bacterium]